VCLGHYLHSVVCVQRKNESVNKQNKDVELERKVQLLESEKQAVDVR